VLIISTTKTEFPDPEGLAGLSLVTKALNQTFWFRALLFFSFNQLNNKKIFSLKNPALSRKNLRKRIQVGVLM